MLKQSSNQNKETEVEASLTLSQTNKSIETFFEMMVYVNVRKNSHRDCQIWKKYILA